MKSRQPQIDIHKHGSSHEETKDDIYPITICPECYSINTKISHYKYFHTGDVHYVRNGIFYRRMMVANYICEDCGCEYGLEFDATEKKELADVDPDIAAIIIAILVWIFSVVSTYCAWSCLNGYSSVDDAPVLLVFWTIASTLVTALGVFLGFFALFE